MENPESVPKEYAIPDDAKEKGLIRIRDREGSLTKVVIEFSDNTLTTVDFDSVGNWRNNAKSALKDEGRNEELITCVMRLLNTIETAKMSAYDVAQSQKAAEEQNNNNKKDSEEGEEEEEETSLKQEVVAKYSGIYEGHPFFKDAITKHMGKPVLFESVIIRGAPYFIGLRPGEKIPIRRKIIKDELKRWQLSPYSELSHESFTFDSEAEIQQIIEQAYNLTLDDVWDRVHSWVERCYDTNDKHIINLITSHIIWTYFCDKIGITPYLFLYGDPGTGKGAILTIISLLGYRIAGMSLGSAAGVFRLLGEVEKGQVGMRIDEANNLENNIHLLETLKLGYKGNEKIPRNFDAMSAENASQKFFYAFGFKMLASEHELNPRLVGGFKTRLLSVKTAFGTPEINIEEVVSYPHKPRNKQILKELGELQKLLFAYRLIHFGDELPDLETNLNGRHRELCIGNFTLFQNTDKFETVKQAFYHVITPQITEKRDSLNVHVAILLKHLGNAKAALIKEKGGGDPRSTVISSDELLSKFQELYDKEQSKVLEGQRNNNEFYNLDPVHFKRVTFESNVIWQAMKKSINAEEIEPRPSDADEDSGSKKKKTGIGQKVLRSDIFSDIGWSWLAHALNTVGATRAPGKVEGKRGWVVDGNRLTRYERSYRRVLEEVSKYEDISVREDYSEADEIGINDGYNADSTQDTPATPPSNRQGCGTVDISNVIVDPIPASTIATITEEENGTNPHPNLSSGGVGGVAGVGGELFYDNNNNDASNQQLLLQPPKPRTSAGNGTHDTLFYGQEWIDWDLEWDPSTKKIYAAGFIDYTSRMWPYISRIRNLMEMRASF
jgi:hypothetical protein